MKIVSSREFRDKQKTYFDSADNGEQIIIQRGKNKSYKLVPIAKDDSLMTKDEFYAKIDRSLKQIKEGKFTRIETKDDLENFLNI